MYSDHSDTNIIVICRNSNDVSRVGPLNWLFHIRKEMESQGINIPDRYIR